MFGAALRSTSGKGKNRAEVRSQVGEDLSSALVALMSEDFTEDDISSIEVKPTEILLGNFYGGSFNNRISLGKEEGVRFSFNDLESYTFPRNSGNENQVLTVSDSNSHTNLIWKDVDDLMSQPWRIQNTTNKATLNTDDIYQQGKVAVGFTKDDEVSDKQLEVKGSIKVVDPGISPYYSLLETTPNLVAEGFDINTPGATSIFGTFDSSNETDTRFEGKNGAGVFARLVKDPVMGRVYTHTTTTKIQSSDTYSLNRFMLSTSSDASHFELSAGNGANSNTEQSYASILGDSYMGRLSFNTEGSTDGSGMYIVKNRGIVFYNGINSAEESYVFPRNKGTKNQILTVGDPVDVPEALNNIPANALVWKDAGDLMSQPWKIQNTENQATANTENIYQQGKVAIGFTKDDVVSDKQLEVKGDAKIMSKHEINSKTLYNILETNSVNVPAGFGPYNLLITSSEPGFVNDIDFAKNDLTFGFITDPNRNALSRMFTKDGKSYSFVQTDSSNNGSFNIGAVDGLNEKGVVIGGDNKHGLGLAVKKEDADYTSIRLRLEEGVVFIFDKEGESSKGGYTFPKNKGTKKQVLTVGDELSFVEDTENFDLNSLVWKNADELVSQPWRIQNTENTATLNSDNIYQQGNVAIGTISDDLLKDEKLYVIGNTKFETGYVNALSPNNEQSSSINTFPNAVYIESNAKNNGVNDGRSYIMNSAGQDLSSQGLLPEVWMSASSDNVDGKAYGDYAIRSSVKEKNSGFGIHNFTAASDISGSLQNTFVGIDDEGLKIGEIKLGTGSSYDNHWGFNGSMVADTYYLPKELPTQGQVLMYGSATSQGGKNIVKTKWESMENLTAGPKYFHAPSIVLPVVSTELSSGMSYDAGSGEFTVNLHTIYANQFGMAGDVNGVSRTALRSNQNDTLPVHTATELSYFITYFDNTVFDPQNISLSNDGILKYKVLTTNITERTYMNIVFKVK